MRLTTSLLAATALPAVASAQLSLRDAFGRADQAAYSNRMAAGATRAQTGQAITPLQGILPNVRFETGYVRTTDPIGTFGATLRQRRITQAEFAPDRLNYPDAVGNYQGGVVIEVPLFNADAWAGRRVATLATGASRATEEWTRISTRVDVVRAYYGAVLATERVATLQAAQRAARAHLAQARAMVTHGLATRADALLASVRSGDIDAQLAEAEGGAAIARRQLAVVLGADGGAEPAEIHAPATLPSDDRIRAVTSADTGAITTDQPRADLRAASDAREAAQADVRRARAAYLPRLNTFARYDWNSNARLYAGDRNWTAGVMASWNLPGSISAIADLETARGHAESARAQADAARAQASVDAEQTRITLAVALTRLTIAGQAVLQSAEAHRIVARKYEGGLATVAELLDAQATDTRSALALSRARYDAIVAAAERRRALGGDPAFLTALERSPALADAPE